MKDRVNKLDQSGAIYEINCTRHNESYIGESGRSLKARLYEHRVVSHNESKTSHSLKKENIGEGQLRGVGERSGTEVVRQSKRLRIKERVNYKDLHSGKNIILTEGNTEVSQHMAKEEHERDDVT